MLTKKIQKKKGRLILLEKVVKSINMTPGKNVPEKSFILEAKKFYTSDENNNIFNSCEIILKKDADKLFKYNIDGLIFTPEKDSIPISNRRITWEHSLKWKPPKLNTIDFLIKIYKENGKEIEKMSAEKGPYKTVHLYVGFSGGYIDPLNDVLNYNKKTYINDFQRKKKKNKKINIDQNYFFQLIRMTHLHTFVIFR